MDKATWQLVLAALTAAGVLWNAFQIDRLDTKVDALTGKVDTIESLLIEHVNTPGLHSRAQAPGVPETPGAGAYVNTSAVRSMPAAPAVLEDWVAESCATR